VSVKSLIIIEKIKNEMRNIETIVNKVGKGFKHAKENIEDADFYLDSVAFNLHGFYSGIEEIFEIIAKAIDTNLPSGNRWHRDLLDQVSIEIAGIRPVVVSSNTKKQLLEFLAFRHLIRDIYTFEINPEKLEKLVKILPETFGSFKEDVGDFIIFLEKM